MERASIKMLDSCLPLVLSRLRFLPFSLVCGGHAWTRPTEYRRRLMLDQEDLKWIATTLMDLNSIVQQIARYADLVRRHKGEHNYIDLLGDRVELASKTAQALFDVVTSKIFASASIKAAFSREEAPTFSVLSPPERWFWSESARAATSQRAVEKWNMPHAAPTTISNESQPSAELGIAPNIQVRNPCGNREYILVIEDEPAVAEMASEVLAEEGYKIIIAHDGFEALKIYEKLGKQIGLVILDFFLPVMDGDAVFDELRGINPKVNVVLSSGFAEQSKIASMLEQGLRGFIPKPYTSDKLLEQVRSTLDAARQVPS
jgi:CheY-like chemotaxis protein